MKQEIIPAILVENFDDFVERIELCGDFAETVQWDIMDGQFVEQMTFSNIKEMSNIDTTLNIEVHLMVDNPKDWIDDLVNAGIERVIIHAESVKNLEKILDQLKNKDIWLGVAVSPDTALADLPDIWDRVNLALIMTVVPGAGGQQFMSSELDKVRELRQRYPDLDIEVDGGINLQTIKLAKEAGANIFAVNSAIFTSPDPANTFEVLKSLVK